MARMSHDTHRAHTTRSTDTTLTKSSPNSCISPLCALSVDSPPPTHASHHALFSPLTFSLSPHGLSTAGAGLHRKCFELIKSGGKSNGFNRERHRLGSEEVIAEVITVKFGGFLFLFVH